MTNEIWGTAVINGVTFALCPLSATKNGLDGRTTRGHVDNYYMEEKNPEPDPFIVNGWQEHAYEECVGGYMGTNQSLLNNSDGSTKYFLSPDGAPLYDFTGEEPKYRDGGHGRRLFAESREYVVETNFSQPIYGYNGNTQGFTFADYKSEIDAGRPVILYLTGHIMLNYGYADDGLAVYLHDTLDYAVHSMAWGGFYANMQHYAVSVLRLAAMPDTIPTVSTTAVSSATINSAASGGNVTSDGGSTLTVKGVCWATTQNPTVEIYDGKTTDGIGTGPLSSAITGLNLDTTYHVRAYTQNSMGTGYGADLTFETAISTIVYVSESDSTCNGNTPSNDTIREAIDAEKTKTGYTLKISQCDYYEVLSLEQPKELTLTGGWDQTYQNQEANKTVIYGSPKAEEPNSSLTFEMLTIKPAQ